MIDITGEKYGRLTAIRHVGSVKCRSKDKYQQKRVWEFRCDCGNLIVRKLAHVRYGYTKSCGCTWREGPPGNKLAHGEASFNGLYLHYKRSAAYRKIHWGLTKDQFKVLTTGRCVYCGQRPSGKHLTHKSANGHYVYSGVDRIDNTLGYEIGNVVSCCSVCNRAKGSMTQIDFESWILKAHRWIYGEMP